MRGASGREAETRRAAGAGGVVQPRGVRAAPAGALPAAPLGHPPQLHRQIDLIWPQVRLRVATVQPPAKLPPCHVTVLLRFGLPR